MSRKADVFASYLVLPVTPLHSDPLLEWEELKTNFPLLWNRAKTSLNIAGTSVPVERIFSKAGATITKTRNRLTEKLVEKIVFMSCISEADYFSK